jgi:hypothetical protein
VEASVITVLVVADALVPLVETLAPQFDRQRIPPLPESPSRDPQQHLIPTAVRLSSIANTAKKNVTWYKKSKATAAAA